MTPTVTRSKIINFNHGFEILLLLGVFQVGWECNGSLTIFKGLGERRIHCHNLSFLFSTGVTFTQVIS